jgi:hypothetical protein
MPTVTDLAKNIRRIAWNPKVHSCVYKRLPLVPVLAHYVASRTISKMYFNNTAVCAFFFEVVHFLHVS